MPSTSKGNASNLVAYGTLEWTFVSLLALLVAASGLFALFLVMQLFRNPSRRP